MTDNMQTPPNSACASSKQGYEQWTYKQELPTETGVTGDQSERSGTRSEDTTCEAATTFPNFAALAPELQSMIVEHSLSDDATNMITVRTPKRMSSTGIPMAPTECVIAHYCSNRLLLANSTTHADCLRHWNTTPIYKLKVHAGFIEETFALWNSVLSFDRIHRLQLVIDLAGVSFDTGQPSAKQSLGSIFTKLAGKLSSFQGLIRIHLIYLIDSHPVYPTQKSRQRLFFEFGKPLLSNIGQVREYHQTLIGGSISKERDVCCISQLDYKHVGKRWDMVDYNPAIGMKGVHLVLEDCLGAEIPVLD